MYRRLRHLIKVWLSLSSVDSLVFIKTNLMWWYHATESVMHCDGGGGFSSSSDSQIHYDSTCQSLAWLHKGPGPWIWNLHPPLRASIYVLNTHSFLLLEWSVEFSIYTGNILTLMSAKFPDNSLFSADPKCLRALSIIPISIFMNRL